MLIIMFMMTMFQNALKAALVSIFSDMKGLLCRGALSHTRVCISLLETIFKNAVFCVLDVCLSVIFSVHIYLVPKIVLLYPYDTFLCE